jgi:transglutaminase-like putative cysteine protease
VSTTRTDGPGEGVLDRLRERAGSVVTLRPTRVLALLAAAGLLGAVLSVLYGIVQVDGDPTVLFLLAGGSVLAATAFARTVRVAVAVGVATVLLSVGLVLYVLSLPHDPQVVAMLESNLKLLTGQSILEIKRSEVWALSVAPTPLFVAWYLSVRGWYSTAALVGGGTLGYFVLTGDATPVQTLLGVVGVAALIGFGDLDRGGASLSAAEPVAVVLAVMVVTPLLVSVTPAGSASPLALGGGGTTTVEASIVETDSEVELVGSISLSPEVRYTVTARESEYWRTSSFDRYTGEGWVRTGESVPVGERPLSAPPGETRRLEQTFEAAAAIGTMPAAWRPVDVSGGAADTAQVTSLGGLDPAEELDGGESYRVTSAVPDVSAESLAAAGSDDPADVDEQFTQLPESTPGRVAALTANVTADASNRYETARTIEQYLETNREYSLDVDRPDGNVADAFLFEMAAGYCTYYATTMVTMLRTQGIPARFTVGYVPGEQVDDDQYVVRGYDSHAWVEVYFPGQGWVPFDPTPAAPRQQAERSRLDAARTQNETNVDTNETNPPQSTPLPESDPTEAGERSQTSSGPGDIDINDTSPGVVGAIQGRPDEFQNREGGSSPLPSSEDLALGAVVLAGAVAGLRRSGLAGRAYRSVWLRYVRRSDPLTDIEAAFDRLQYLLERRHRPRREGETVRQYLDAIDADRRARRLTQLRERAYYGGVATREMADEAVALLEELREE